MKWEFNDDTPIYLQIMEHFKTEIASGSMKAGDKIPSVRELALEAGVNPNTMQKALSELEREGLLESQRTSGRFVADGVKTPENLKNSLAQNLMRDFLKSMTRIGYTPEESVREYEDYVKNNM
ncbi:MAG: GntR family transcriptional regulator [Eubacteriales bacterium]|nr:GntR family transcriptional regulator [Eubacteriales bacterium]